jgi:hypothetical protein
VVNRKFSYRLIALLLACNYFAFQTEVFEDEYAEQHPAPTTQTTFASPTLGWESFDKDNAPPPFTFNLAMLALEIVWQLADEPDSEPYYYKPLFTIRDKSPPLA